MLSAASLTEMGNLAVTAPSAVMGVVILYGLGARRLAWTFGIEVLVVFTATVLLKIWSDDTGGAFEGTLFALSHGAPSGHMAMSIAVYGGAAVICARRGAMWLRVSAPVIAAVVIGIIGVTRVLVHAHLPADVLAACMVAGYPLYRLGQSSARATRVEDRAVLPFIVALTVTAALAFAFAPRFTSAFVF